MAVKPPLGSAEATTSDIDNGSDTHYSDGEGANQSGGEKDEKHGGDSLSMEETKTYEEFKSKVTE